MKLRIYILLIGFYGISFIGKADPTSYSQEVLITAESEHYIVNHYHNWTTDTEKELWEMISTDQNPFTENNNYAYIELIDKNTCKVIFKKPSTALTQIKISQNEKHIVGISNIMVWNPYQLIIYDINGTLVKKRNFSSEEAKMNASQYDKFSIQFPKQCEELTEYTYSKNDFVYIDFLRMGMPKELGEAWDFLFQYLSPNHLTPNMWETTTNYIYWFDEENPEIRLNYINEKLTTMNINDPKKKRIEISIRE